VTKQIRNIIQTLTTTTTTAAAAATCNTTTSTLMLGTENKSNAVRLDHFEVSRILLFIYKLEITTECSIIWPHCEGLPFKKPESN